MTRKLSCLIYLIGAIAFLSAQAVNYDFTTSRRVTAYPLKEAAALVETPEGYVLSKTPEQELLCAYFYASVPANANALTVAVTYKSSANANPQISLNFNRQGGPNGGNGTTRVNLPSATEWTTSSAALVDIPPESAIIQCVLSGQANAYELAFQKITFSFLDDNAVVASSAPGFDPELPPSEWSSGSSLTGFYFCVSAEPALEQTELKLTYDASNLYVGFIAPIDSPDELRRECTNAIQDAPIFTDDCFELFISAPFRHLAWQFATNPNNCTFEAELKQNMPGDPWKVFSQWNGSWKVINHIDKKDWQATFIIPWKSLGFDGLPTQSLGFNAGRENKAGRENSQWNSYDGSFHDVDKYAIFDLKTGKITRTRRIDRASYVIERANPQYETLLSKEPGNYKTGTWGCVLAKSLPAKIRDLYTPEEQLEWQEKLMGARGEAGMLGCPLPWANNTLIGGWEKMRQLKTKYGTSFPYVLFNSYVSRKAIQAGAKYFRGDTGVDPACESYRNYVVDSLTDLTSKYYYQDYLDLTGLVFGIDEPTNEVANIYSISRNPQLADALKDADAEIKAKTGFGKFGLHDPFAAEPATDIEFLRIAFWRWWNGNFQIYVKEVSQKVKEVFPEAEFKSIDRNTVSGICPTDVALLGPYSDWISCDPYPTSTAGIYGFARAIYHPGFSAKMLGDLATPSKLCVTPQNFIYHGGKPTPAEVREWASQCLKVGAGMLYWYIEDFDTIRDLWDTNLEVLSINKQLKSMPRVVIPTQTVSAILHSDYDRWGLSDNVLHPAYTLYALLGEQTKAWFRFISPTGLAMGTHSLAGLKVIYIPRMKFTDPATTARLLAFVEAGGTIVSFDPDFLSFNLDASPVPERLQLFGAKLLARTIDVPELSYGAQKLPIYKIANLPGAENGNYQAYDFASLPADASIVASYDDGKPAIIKRPFGKGNVILAAVQPFGNSDAARSITAWQGFIEKICQEQGEATKLPIWDFYLKKLPENDVKLDLLIKW